MHHMKVYLILNAQFWLVEIFDFTFCILNWIIIIRNTFEDEIIPRPRGIVAKFERRKDRNKVLSKAIAKLKNNKQFIVHEQYPIEIIDRMKMRLSLIGLDCYWTTLSFNSQFSS
jgi:hypothetical protein